MKCLYSLVQHRLHVEEKSLLGWAIHAPVGLFFVAAQSNAQCHALINARFWVVFLGAAEGEEFHGVHGAFAMPAPQQKRRYHYPCVFVCVCV